MSGYVFTFEDEYQGVPCIIGVVTYHVVPPWKGSAYSCPSDLDFYGYTDVEWEILKMDGKTYFEWLDKRLTKKDRAEIEDRITSKYDEIDKDCGEY